MINSIAKAPKIIPKIFCKTSTTDLPKKEAVILEVKKIRTVKKITMYNGNNFVYISKKLRVKSSEIKIERVITDGPAIRGIAIGKIENEIK